MRSRRHSAWTAGSPPWWPSAARVRDAEFLPLDSSDDGDGGSALDLAAPRDASEEGGRGVAARMVADLMGRLPDDRARFVIACRFGIGGPGPLTLDEVGRRLGMTGARVQQIQKAALASLRSVPDASRFEELCA